MASVYWRHPANAEVAQVWKGTITTTTNGHTYAVTITDDDGTIATITYTVVNPPDTSATLVATGFIAAWNASTNPLVARFTATQSAGQVILTSDTAGIPATFSTSGTGTWSGTGNTTSNAGNNDYSATQNWSGDALPTTGDNVYFDVGSVAIKWGLNQSSVAIGDFVVFPGCTSQFGQFVNGSPHYLRIDPDKFEFKGASTLGLFNIGSANIPVLIEATGTPQTNRPYAIYLKGSNITTATINKGKVGIAVLEGETATIATAKLGYVSAQSTDAELTLGSGVTLTTWDQGGGVGYVNCAATTVTVASGGTLTTGGSGAITTFNGLGTCYLNSTGTVTTLNVYGTVDLTRSRIARTITSTVLYPGSTLRTGSWITHTNAPTGTGTIVRVG